jgi:lipid-A-disaccharide synthase
MSHKVFIIAGEPSGDLHGSNLVKALLRQEPDINIECWGGDRMAAAGATVKKHVDELAFMGFVEVIANLRTILKNFALCKQHIESFKPEMVVLIDYPGFNLRMAKFIQSLGIRVVYYISPQIWAWKESRVKKIQAYVDDVFVILPFEQAFFEKHGVKAEFVGHPLLDEIRQIHVDEGDFKAANQLDPERPIIALLPGSRKQEIIQLLEPIAAIIPAFPTYQFVVSKVSWQPRSLYELLPSSVKVMEGNTYQLLKVAEAAIVTSGTATLETALIGTPQVVVYRANPISVWIARRLIKVRFISLVNLIMDREVVRELIQTDVSPSKLKHELSLIVKGGASRQHVLHGYEELISKLGAKGASEFVASRLLKIIASKG